MKKLLLFMVLALSMSFVSCEKNGGASSPEGAAKIYMDALLSGDSDAAMGVALKNSHFTESEQLKDFKDISKRYVKMKTHNGYKYKIGRVKKNDKRALVEIIATVDGQTEPDLPLVIENEGGKWKVDLFSFVAEFDPNYKL